MKKGSIPFPEYVDAILEISDLEPRVYENGGVSNNTVDIESKTSNDYGNWTNVELGS